MILQLNMTDARKAGKEHHRAEYALIFESIAFDESLQISGELWPKGKGQWPWILMASSIVPLEPFSLSELLGHDYYTSEHTIRFIRDSDASKIEPKLLWAQAFQPRRKL